MYKLSYKGLQLVHSEKNNPLKKIIIKIYFINYKIEFFKKFILIKKIILKTTFILLKI